MGRVLALATLSCREAGAEITTSTEGGSSEIVWNDSCHGRIYGVSLK